MNGVSSVTHPAAAVAFDGIAASYDDLFTRSVIGRAQRKQVWRKLLHAFPQGSRLLELNCGTGEDARFLTARNRSVLACDASAAMITIANRYSQPRRANLQYLQLANENLDLLGEQGPFDGAFSNFSGLNCLDDLRPVARNLAELVRPECRVLLCLWSRFCLAELFWYLLHTQASKAIRRINGKATATISGITISVYYPTVRAVRKLFSAWFRLESQSAVGLFVPPSYTEEWIRKHDMLLPRLESLDQHFAEWPVLRNLGDHVLLEFVRCKR
jgi:SAM-dependent methyltransferase